MNNKKIIFISFFLIILFWLVISVIIPLPIEKSLPLVSIYNQDQIPHNVTIEMKDSDTNLIYKNTLLVEQKTPYYVERDWATAVKIYIPILLTDEAPGYGFNISIDANPPTHSKLLFPQGSIINIDIINSTSHISSTGI